MQLVRRRPFSWLDGTLVGMTGYREYTPTVLTTRMPAASIVPVIVSFGERIDVEVGDRTGGRFSSFVAGLSTEPASTHQRGDQACVQVDLTPLGAYRLLGVPGVELAGEVVELSNVDNRLGCVCLFPAVSEDGQRARLPRRRTTLVLAILARTTT